MIILATLSLNVGHPGLAFGPRNDGATKSSRDEEYTSSEEVKQEPAV